MKATIPGYSRLAAVCLAASVAGVSAQTNRAPGYSHEFICCDSYGNKVTVFGKDGSVVWQHSCPMPQDCWRLANGNYLFTQRSGVLEMTQGKKVVWEYKAPEKTEVHACQPLSDGKVMVVEAGTSRIVEVDREGKIAKEIKLPVPPPPITTHDQFRGTRKSKDGNYFVSCKGQRKVIELDVEGKVLREIPVPGDVHEVVPLRQGNLLIACGDGHKVIELDASGKVVWEVNENDLPGHPLRLMTGCQRLPNGNTILCNWLGHGHIGEQADVVEITPDKKVVWEFVDHTHIKSINQIQVFDVPGDASKGEILR
jgi:outer membrane protein assembly factor BamB